MARKSKKLHHDEHFTILACVAVIVIAMALMVSALNRPSTVEVSYAKQLNSSLSK